MNLSLGSNVDGRCVSYTMSRISSMPLVSPIWWRVPHNTGTTSSWLNVPARRHQRGEQWMNRIGKRIDDGHAVPSETLVHILG